MASFAFDLKVFGRRLHFDLSLAPIKPPPVLERIDGVRYEIDTDAHTAAVVRLAAKRTEDAETAKNAAARTAEAQAADVARLEAECTRLHAQASTFEAERDVARIERQCVADEMDRMKMVFLTHELDARRAN